MKNIYVILTSCIALLLFLTGSGHAQTQKLDIAEKQVKKFMSVNRSNMLINYVCSYPKQLSKCSITCSSGGHTYLRAKNVKKAYYAERLKRVDGNLAGFFLIADVQESDEGQDLYATLQLESSCTFEGLSPQF